MLSYARMNIHRVRRRALVVAGALLGLTLSGCSVPGVYTYVSAGQASSGAGGPKVFDPDQFVAENWTTKVLPTVNKDAVEAPTLLSAISEDQSKASNQYGTQAGTGSPFAFLIKGEGKVTHYDASNPSQPITVDIDGVPSKIKVQIVTGQAIAGTALRDAVRFITFSEFKNQLDYADVGTQLNNRVKKDVLSPLNAKSLVGKQVNFTGAFSLIAPNSVLIVPTSLKEHP